jgi:hypothetical protein
MKKTLLTLGLVLTLVFTMFALTGCEMGGGEKEPEGRPTKEISYEGGLYVLKVTVPCEKNENDEEVPVYEFEKEIPEAATAGIGTGEGLVGDKIVMTYETESYVYHTATSFKEAHGDVTPSFEGFKEYVDSDEYTGTIDSYEMVKFGDRDAMRYEQRVGSGKGDFYGYCYMVNIDDLYPKGRLNLVIVAADGNPENAEAVFADPEVKAIIDSIRIEAAE